MREVFACLLLTYGTMLAILTGVLWEREKDHPDPFSLGFRIVASVFVIFSALAIVAAPQVAP